jgi:hypothetical protein
VFFVVYRTQSGDGCVYPPTDGTQKCVLQMGSIGHTGIRFLEDTPPPGRYAYRVGISASWRDDVQNGDVILLSPPVTADIRCTTEKCKRDLVKLRAAGKVP